MHRTGLKAARWAHAGRVACAAVATVMLGGCVTPPPKLTSEDERRDAILTALNDASTLAVNAQRELAMTSDASVQRQATARQRLLSDRVSYDFYGDVEEVVGDIAGKYGYELRVTGKRPPDRVNVNVFVKKMSVVEVLRYIGTTAGFWLDLSVKPGVIELAYKSKNG